LEANAALNGKINRGNIGRTFSSAFSYSNKASIVILATKLYGCLVSIIPSKHETNIGSKLISKRIMIFIV